VRVLLVQHAVEFVEALTRRNSGAACGSESPLADESVRYPRSSDLGYGNVFRSRSTRALPRIRAWPKCLPSINDDRDGAQTVLPQ
jgi:hypothetical protein